MTLGSHATLSILDMSLSNHQDLIGNAKLGKKSY